MVDCKWIDLPNRTSPDSRNSSIRDTRLFVEILEGSAITFGIASKDVLSKWWAPMKLHKSLERVVTKMNGANFGMNVTYSDGKQ